MNDHVIIPETYYRFSRLLQFSDKNVSITKSWFFSQSWWQRSKGKEKADWKEVFQLQKRSESQLEQKYFILCVHVLYNFSDLNFMNEATFSWHLFLPDFFFLAHTEISFGLPRECYPKEVYLQLVIHVTLQIYHNQISVALPKKIYNQWWAVLKCHEGLQLTRTCPWTLIVIQYVKVCRRFSVTLQLELITSLNSFLL